MSVAVLRKDLEVVAGLIPNGAHVLDVGCGEGELLTWLQTQKSVSGRGIELSQQGVNGCIAKGLSVIQGDADTDLQYYPDQQFDYAILSQTLQALRRPKDVLEHMVRIARYAVVSVPNFGHWKNRMYLSVHGRMPVTETLSYQWYDTPNIHFCTIRDFVTLCEEMGFAVEQRLYVTHQGTTSYFRNKGLFANFFGEQGVFMICRK